MDIPYCPNHIASKYKTLKAAKAYVEKAADMIVGQANVFKWGSLTYWCLKRHF